VPNDKIDEIIDDDVPLIESLRMADEVLRQGVAGISGIILDEGLINLDFADVETIMKDKGLAHMGVGQASGKSKVENAARAALTSPLLETSTDGAKSVLIAFTGDPSISMRAITRAASEIKESLHPEAVIIFGATINPNFKDEVMVTVVATDIEDVYESRKPISSPDILRIQPSFGNNEPPNIQTAQDENDDTPDAVEAPPSRFKLIDENEGIRTPSFLKDWKNRPK